MHNIEGLDQVDTTYVRFINTGFDAISGIRGRLRGTDGEVIGLADRMLFASLVAPSPDWFVGLSEFSLLDERSRWIDDTGDMNLPVWDAGTETGNRFSLAGTATDPPEPFGRFNVLHNGFKAPLAPPFLLAGHRSTRSNRPCRPCRCVQQPPIRWTRPASRP